MATNLKPTLNGRVFSRLQQFHALPQALKNEVASLETHLTTIQTEVFAKHHTLQLKSMRGVRYKLLSEKVYDWVQEREQAPTTPPAEAVRTTLPKETAPQSPAKESTQQPEPLPVAVHTADTSEVPASATVLAAPTMPVSPAMTEEISASSEEEADAKRAAVEATKTERLTHAKRLIDALVLKGFITPNKEDKSVAPMMTEVFDFKDSDLLVPLATAITGLTIPTTTVWDLIDGAVFAELLKRRAGLLAPLTHGKDVYVVVNARAQSITLFESDVAREPIMIYEAALTHVTFDKTQYANGVKLWCETDSELLNTASVGERDALTKALEAIGVTYQDHEPLPEHHTKPASEVLTSHTFTVEQLTSAASNAVPLDDTAETFKTNVPSGMETTTSEPLRDSDKTTLQDKQFDVSNQTETPTSETAPVHHESYKAEKLSAHQTRSPTKKHELKTEKSKHDETLASSPTTEMGDENLFGVGFTGDDSSNSNKKEEEAVVRQKADKVMHFDCEDTQPTTKMEGSPPKSNYFGLWTTSNANTNNTKANSANTVNHTNTNAP